MKKEEKVLKRIINKSTKFFVVVLCITLVIALAFGSMAAGIMTVIPAETFGWEASKASYLGYYAVCSFAPFSTLSLSGLSVVGFILLRKLWKYLGSKINIPKINLRYKVPTQKR